MISGCGRGTRTPASPTAFVDAAKFPVHDCRQNRETGDRPMTCRPLWGLLPLLLLCGCGAIQRQQVEQIKNTAHTEMAACHGSPKVAKWRCINAILIRENEALHNPDMDLIQSLAAAHLRIAADQDAGRVSDVEAEARHREAIATA